MRIPSLGSRRAARQPHGLITAALRRLLPSPLCRGEYRCPEEPGDLAQPGACVRKTGLAGRATETAKPPGSPPLHAAAPRTWGGAAGISSFRAARPPLPRAPRFALGPGGPGVPGPLLPAARPVRPRPRPGGRPVPQSVRRHVPAGAGAGGTVGGRGPGGRPRATHASNLLFILSPPLSPLSHRVTSVLPGPSGKGPATSGCTWLSGTSARRSGAGQLSRGAGSGRMRTGAGPLRSLGLLGRLWAAPGLCAGCRVQTPTPPSARRRGPVPL